ncbi:PAS domain-containing protein [Thermanaerosceptrum fracticalcis]|uniref:PAS domain-containing protein n=1 Tax=Thermanaerosceptrum fracticalcis TaxID=1712410 RepID=A0A7G6E7U5_THEFR|nr:sigma 54-interacting transcriptional regulator [Thermanaerosceptrum fracticalcis]QNB48149.1 PAS domain-containing protein [Thermanaerosceptrum fracticalcis]
MEKIKIGCLTYKHLDALARSAINKINDDSIEVVLIEGLMENLIEKVKEAFTDSVEIFVGGGANAETIMQATQYPVLRIHLTGLDYLEALLKAKELGKNVGIVSYKYPVSFDLNKLEKMSGMKIVPVIFHDTDELEQKLLSSNIEVVIGASLSIEIATKLGLGTVLIYPGEDAIISTIREAKNVAIALRKEREKSKISQAILDFSLSGVIATDAKGQINIYNPSAERILGISSQQVLGKPLKSTFPELNMEDVLKTGMPQIESVEQVNGTEIVINRVPIENGGKIFGSVATFQKVSDIQRTEHKIRLLNKLKGFSAKANFSDIIGSSKIMQSIIEKAKIYAKTNSNILIYGETGVGKEIFAQSIHNYSFRQNGPFVAINCAALPENLLESELFGYDEGAFTGSRKGGKAGLFELAHKGTIFLDEIGEISLALQARLLRVIQEKEVIRIGGDAVIPVDIRIIAATNKKLEDKMPYEFRDDLYYRLNVLQLTIPALRQRKEDIRDLFLRFLKKHLNINQLSEDMIEHILPVLTLYSWPGNIRELQNVVERFAVLFNNTIRLNNYLIRELLVTSIGEDKLVNDLLRQFNYHSTDKIKGKEISSELIEKLELVFPDNKSKIAEKLGISRTTLWRSTK